MDGTMVKMSVQDGTVVLFIGYIIHSNQNFIYEDFLPKIQTQVCLSSNVTLQERLVPIFLHSITPE